MVSHGSPSVRTERSASRDARNRNRCAARAAHSTAADVGQLTEPTVPTLDSNAVFVRLATGFVEPDWRELLTS